jgi:long-subunit acyl-CoA synthetase (AMP-forming)
MKGDHVAVFGENSAHWLFVDNGLQTLGACKFYLVGSSLFTMHLMS